MGQKELSSILKEVQNPGIENFEILKKIGEGGFGKVYKVNYKKENKILALKKLSKERILEKKSTKYIFNERDILLSLYSTSISNLYCTFQDKNNLYMILDYLPGGDLRNLINKYEFFLEEEIKFISGCIIIGLEYLQLNNIIHRDIKPENLILDEKGYIRISDFGISIKNDFNKKNNIYNDYCGTIGYMSPERFNKFNQISFESNYFSLGVIIYELMKFERPFKGSNKNEMIEEFQNKKINLNKNNVDYRYSENLCDFVNQLLEINPEKRLGKNGIQEIKNHPFFQNFNWKCIQYYKSGKSPFSIKNLKNEKKEKAINKKLYNNNNLNNNKLIPEKYEKEFEDFSKIHLIDENNLNINYRNKIKSIPSLINGNNNLFKIMKKKSTFIRNKLNSLDNIENNFEIKIENKNFEQILEHEKIPILTQYQNRKSSKNQSGKLPFINFQKQNNVFPKEKKSIPNIMKMNSLNQNNSSLLNSNKTLLKLKKIKPNKFRDEHEKNSRKNYKSPITILMKK